MFEKLKSLVIKTEFLTQFQTRRDVGDDCRHDMRPSVQLPSVSGAASQLGLTMVMPSLQSAPDLPALATRK